MRITRIADKTSILSKKFEKELAIVQQQYPTAVQIWLTGSQADGTATAKSDIDFVVIVDANAGQLKGFQQGKIDVGHIYDFGSPWFKKYIMPFSVLVYDD